MSNWLDIELDEILAGYALRNEDLEEIPAITVFINNIRWQRAEIDVGIMSDYVDDWSESYSVGDKEFDRWQRNAFIEEIRTFFDEDAISLNKVIEDTIKERVSELGEY